MSTYVECEQKVKELTEKKNQLEGKISEYNTLQSELARYRFAAYDKSRSGKIIGIGDRVAYRKVKKLEKQIEKLEPVPSNEEVKAIDKELEDYFTQLKSLPRIMETKTIAAKIVGRWSYDCNIFVMKLSNKRKWFAYNAEGALSPYTYDVIPNKENIPIQVKRYLRNSDTYGYLWCWIYNVKLDVLPTEDITPIVDRPTESISKAEEGKQAGSTPFRDGTSQLITVNDLLTKERICPKCGAKNFAKFVTCQNCAMDISKVALTPKEQYLPKSTKKKKKRRLF